jgi:hypothetical protein
MRAAFVAAAAATLGLLALASLSPTAERPRAGVAEAKSFDEVKDIRNKAEALRAYARQAKNKQLESDAIEICDRCVASAR